jgi:hypothetical protein
MILHFVFERISLLTIDFSVAASLERTMQESSLWGQGEAVSKGG